MRRLQTKPVQYLRTMEQVASGFGCVPLRQLVGLVWTSEEAFVAPKDWAHSACGLSADMSSERGFQV